jgi:hypothetical protein
MLANVGYTMQKCLPMSKLKFKRVSPDINKEPQRLKNKVIAQDLEKHKSERKIVI